VSDLLLDTHVWLWYAEGLADTLSTDAVTQINQARKERRLHVSVISAWEIGLLLARNRTVLSAPLQDWIEQGAALPGLRVRALTTEVAIESTLLPGDLHADPADRFLIAEARVEGLTLVTADRKIIDYGRAGHVRVLGAW
jgi:PIN domain nuclease of toxin-antitoxin system